MRVVERPFSEFLRQPNEVVAELEEHDVVLRRRNAPALRLSDASRDDERAQAFDALAGCSATCSLHSPAGLADAVDDVFPWATLLPKRDRVTFVDELGRTLVAASALDSYAGRAAPARVARNGRDPRRPATRPSPAHRHRRRRRPGRGAGGLTHGAKAEGTGSASARARRLGVPVRDERRGQGMGAGLLGCARQRSRGWERITTDPRQRDSRQHPLRDRSVLAP